VQVSAARSVSAFTARALFLGGLFLFVIILQGALVASLRGLGINGGPALLISGAAILPAVLAVAAVARWLSARAAAKLDAQREAAALPNGACCVIWREQGGAGADFPWELQGDVQAAYPKLARRLGIEGFAVVDFEVGADGAAKNLHLVDVWPAAMFYGAATEALRQARFALRPGAAPRFGPSYRIPFVFRIRGAAKVRDKGHSAMSPAVHAAKRGAIAAGGATWRGAKGAGVLLMVLFRELKRFTSWAGHGLAHLLERIAAHLRNLKRI
jgi:TonB family protein